MPLECQIPQHVTGLYVFAVLNLLALFHISVVTGDVVVNQGNVSIIEYKDLPAAFGPLLTEDPLTGYLVYIKPKVNSSCTEYAPPPPENASKLWIALISRNGCKFDEMVIRAQSLGYNAAIVMNKAGDESLVSMGGDSHADMVTIPSVFVGFTAGTELRQNFCYDCNRAILGEFTVTIEPYVFPSFKPYILWPFAVVVGTCFVLMLVFMIFKWCRDMTRKRKSRLSTKVLKKIPTKKFKKGDAYDVCAICLDDYEEGDKLRILPCSHAYHCTCIDPWLTKKKKTCPVCKRKVIPGSNPDSESDSDTEDTQSTSERTPLLSGNNNTASSSPRRSTFDNSGLPEAVRSQVRTVNEVSQDSSDYSDSDESEAGARAASTATTQGNVVVNRAVVNRGYFKSSSEEEEEDSDEEEEGTVGAAAVQQVLVITPEQNDNKNVNQVV